MRTVALALLACALAACTTMSPSSRADVQRATRGPTAEDVFLARFVQHYKRPPTFDEHIAWKDDLEARILRYLAERPELNASPRASQFRSQRMVMVGMRKDDIMVLLDKPDATTQDPAAMQAVAGQFWAPIAQHAKEMWTYPAAWALYFDGDLLVDVTVSDGRALQ